MKEPCCNKEVKDQRFSTRFLLKNICNKFQTMVDNVLSKYELTSTQANFLFFLFHSKDSLIQKDFEDFFEISHSAATGILSRLKEKDMVRFAQSEKDRRCKQILICDKGRQVVDKIKIYANYEKDYVFKNFSSEEKEELNRLLKKLIGNLDETMEMEKNNL